MAPIVTSRKLTLRWDGHVFIPSEPVEFEEGKVVTVTLEEHPPEVSPEEMAIRQARWEKIKSTFGMISAPEGFNWNFDRDELYRDIQ